MSDDFTYRDPIEAKLAEIETKLDSVLAEARKINGRVSRLEEWRTETELSKEKLKGQLWVITKAIELLKSDLAKWLIVGALIGFEVLKQS